ncbi:MAG TPA: hypothetical protein VG273_10590 [Bryobacteraceae bacterium]|jgi:ABC-type transport system involved in multi-copper enzyme maturation permease subunit|nr:hypothetical protein [Bryobacteraceae bacterium]
MLWYKTLFFKSWVETRWRFLIGLALLICSAIGVVLTYPQVAKLLPLASSIRADGELGRRIREAAEIQRTYSGYVWSQWFRQDFPQMWTIFAVLLGTGSAISQTSGGGALFTLSMPVSRTRLLAVRAATGYAQLLLLAFVPSILIPLFSPAVGQTYSLLNALVYSALLFIGGEVFFTFAFFLQTEFTDIWRPMGIALSVAAVIGLSVSAFPEASRYSPVGVMVGEDWFREGHLPWRGLLICVAASALMLYGAARNIARHDF